MTTLVNNSFFLVPFEPSNAYACKRVLLERSITCGQRSDYFTASVTPRFEASEIVYHKAVSQVVLAPRHAGFSISTNSAWPVHVYVCVPKYADEVDMTTLASVQPTDLIILSWGLLCRTEEEAERVVF